jgi:hypothetical protein
MSNKVTKLDTMACTSETYLITHALVFVLFLIQDL